MRHAAKPDGTCGFVGKRVGGQDGPRAQNVDKEPRAREELESGVDARRLNDTAFGSSALTRSPLVLQLLHRMPQIHSHLGVEPELG